MTFEKPVYGLQWKLSHSFHFLTQWFVTLNMCCYYIIHFLQTTQRITMKFVTQHPLRIAIEVSRPWLLKYVIFSFLYIALKCFWWFPWLLFSTTRGNPSTLREPTYQGKPLHDLWPNYFTYFREGALVSWGRDGVWWLGRVLDCNSRLLKII